MPSASRPSRAVNSASLAVWQPAVLGRMCTPAWRSVPSSDPVPPGATRRMATVLTAVPEAASTRPSTSRLGTPPVPTMSRELSSRPPSSQVSPGSAWAAGPAVAFRTLVSVIVILPARP